MSQKSQQQQQQQTAEKRSASSQRSAKDRSAQNESVSRGLDKGNKGSIVKCSTFFNSMNIFL